jgi:iron only hydrogenase large subunit-like protein
MPCFDKKLEGTRDNNTDLVLTTVELIQILDEFGDFKEFQTVETDDIYSAT